MSFDSWLARREISRFPRIGDGDFVMKRVYTTLRPFKTWNDTDPSTLLPLHDYGSIFNLEFSPEGNILAAACEKKAVILFDAIAQKYTNRIMDAHTDNVNCIKFLDNRTFATCSDDTTVAIWDTRFLNRKLRSLQGHSNWVKNVEYSRKDGLLVTSGFDGSIFTWDINSHTEEGLIYQKVFNTSGLMRCRISPDGNKMVLCTTGGFLMIIHNLDLNRMHKDLCGFRPSIYRLMQMGNQFIPQAAKYDHLFSKDQLRNRVELVTDFPMGNEAEIIHALQIHPQGLSFLSRNISYDDATEWSCIHDIDEELYDITEPKPDNRKRKRSFDEKNIANASSGKRAGIRYLRKNHPRGEVTRDQPSTSAGLRPTPAACIRRVLVSNNTAGTSSTSSGNGPGIAQPNGSNSNTTNRPNTRSSADRPGPPGPPGDPDPQIPPIPPRSEFVPDIWAAEMTVEERAARQARGRSTNSVTGYDFVYAISSGILPLVDQNNVFQQLANQEQPYISTFNELVPYKEKHILQNADKQMFYIQESNDGKGFIKEPCFSADGRLICSPYQFGVRLLSYSPDCSIHPSRSEKEQLKKKPKELVTVKTIRTHSDIVLSSAFSPRQPLLVTGCKLGKITWIYPNI